MACGSRVDAHRGLGHGKEVVGIASKDDGRRETRPSPIVWNGENSLDRCLTGKVDFLLLPLRLLLCRDAAAASGTGTDGADGAGAGVAGSAGGAAALVRRGVDFVAAGDGVATCEGSAAFLTGVEVADRAMVAETYQRRSSALLLAGGGGNRSFAVDDGSVL